MHVIGAYLFLSFSWKLETW